MIRVIKIVESYNNADAGEVNDFYYAKSVGAFFLGKRLSHYLIVKDGYIFKPSSDDVALLEKELELFKYANNTEQQVRTDNSCEHYFSPVYQCVHCGKIGDSIA